MRKLITLLTILVWTADSNAQITYHNIEPDTTVNSWDAFQLKPSTVPSNDITIWWHPAPEVVVQTHGNCQVLFDDTSLPSKLEFGDTITTTANWNAGAYDTLSYGSTGNWTFGANDKYLGFRFKNTTSSWYYGWLMMSVAPGASSFTVSEWAYNSVAGQPIKAGQADATGIVSAKREQIEIRSANGSLQFTGLHAGTNYPISISNTNGQIVHTTNIRASESLDISGYAKGVYIVALVANGFVYSFKLPVM